jgi:predicted homoserine dehydrogenase-like protein
MGRLEARVAELEKTFREAHSMKVSFDVEWYLGGIRMNPGVYVVMRLDDKPEKVEIPFL